MAASSLLISSLPGLILGDVKNSNNTSAVCPIKSPLRGRLDTNKLGFVSCKAFGNGTLSTGKLKVSYMSKRKFSGHSAGVARCETTDENKNSLDIWLGRAAMLAFVGVISVEVATGKGVLENVGLVAPLPTLALALMAVVGGITAFGIFRSVNDS